MPEPDGLRLEPEYREHYAAYLRGRSPRAASALLEKVAPVLETGVRAFGGPANPMVRARARRIALDAVGTYDPRRASLKTHLLNHLKGLQRYAAGQARLLSVPERVEADRRHLERHEAALRDELGREPSSLELADRSGLSIPRQTFVRKYRPGFAEGQATRVVGGEGGEDRRDPAVARPPDLEGKALFLFHDLPPVDQAILEHGLGLHGRKPMTVGQLALKLNLSPGRISQRASRLQEMLDSLDDTGLF